MRSKKLKIIDSKLQVPKEAVYSAPFIICLRLYAEKYKNCANMLVKKKNEYLTVDILLVYGKI